MLLLSSILLLSITATFGQLVFNNNPNCGTRPLARDDNIKITNGEETIPGDWGWSVSITQNGQHFCGGVLVHERYVLTAAHCVMGRPLTSVHLVEIGLHDRKNKEVQTQLMKIEKWWGHETFNQLTTYDDIAIIKLADSVKFNNYAVPACIYQSYQNEPIEGRYAYVTGWGATALNGPATDKKNQALIRVLSKQRCKEKFGFRLNPDRQICAGEEVDNLGACQGDSGGPLVTKASDGKWYLYGLVSWGFGCGSGTVYNRVEAYIAWINAKMAL